MCTHVWTHVCVPVTPHLVPQHGQILLYHYMFVCPSHCPGLPNPFTKLCTSVCATVRPCLHSLHPWSVPHLGQKVGVHASVHVCMSTQPMLFPICSIVVWKCMCPSMVPWACTSHCPSGPTPWSESVHASLMYACPPQPWGLPYAIAVVVPRHVCPCVAKCVCTSHWSSNSSPWQKICKHHYIQMSTSPQRSSLLHLCSCVKHVCPCVAYVSVLTNIWLHTLVRKCTCISTCMDVHLTLPGVSYPLYIAAHNRCSTVTNHLDQKVYM